MCRQAQWHTKMLVAICGRKSILWTTWSRYVPNVTTDFISKKFFMCVEFRSMSWRVVSDIRFETRDSPIHSDTSHRHRILLRSTWQSKDRLHNKTCSCSSTLSIFLSIRLCVVLTQIHSTDNSLKLQTYFCMHKHEINSQSKSVLKNEFYALQKCAEYYEIQL